VHVPQRLEEVRMGSMDEFSRERAILSDLRSVGRVQVNDLATRFGVSAVTVRKDLDSLERRSLLRRVRGGAVGVSVGEEGSFEARLEAARGSKLAIARAGSELVHDGDAVAVDSSTTGFYLARELLNRHDLTVVTNGLRLAMLLMERSSARVLVLGGTVRRPAGSLVGALGGDLIGRGRIAKGFFGLAGLSPAHGLMDISAEEAQTKRLLVNACESVYGIFDSTKVKGFGLHSFAPTSAVAGLYTDDGAPDGFVAEWGRLGVPVAAVRPEPGAMQGRLPIESHASNQC
jgi:DeoR/GlpR family transcriptional regulator of sugar metabolism